MLQNYRGSPFIVLNSFSAAKFDQKITEKKDSQICPVTI